MSATEYELWATQHGMIDVQQVQVLEFAHDNWPSSLWVTDYGERFTATTEDARQFTAEAVAFDVDLPKSSNSTQSEMTIRLDALAGYVVTTIRNMTDADRALPIRIAWRPYLDNNRSAPTLGALKFVVLEITATRVAVELRCAVTIFPNVGSGVRYTIDRFPSLAYL